MSLTLVTACLGMISRASVFGPVDGVYIARFYTGAVTACPARLRVIDGKGKVLAWEKETVLASSKWTSGKKYIVEIEENGGMIK